MRRTFTKMKPEFLRCRTMGHRWNDMAGGSWTHKVEYLHGHRQTSRCTSCRGLKEEVWSVTTGQLLCRYYRMPKGYSMAGVTLPEGATLREVMRVEYSARDKAERLRARREARTA